MKEGAMKINGQWYVGPKEYGVGIENQVAFYWPSKTPANSEKANVEAAKRPGGDESAVRIEIFLRSDNRLQPPHGYELVRLAETNGWIHNRTTLRKGLDRIEMKPVIAPWGDRIDYATYYVATELRGADGLPPVATCNHKHSSYGGGFGVAWHEGTVVGTRMNQYHCTDLPELYMEAVRILTLLKKV
jgi:hypothetical protein